jgi:hypothetical protein
VARPLSELDDDLLELPQGSLADDDEVGVEDAEELLFQELDLGGEEIGLDTETGASADTFGSMIVDDVDDGEDDPLDDSTLQIDADIDGDEDEQGWLEESDGAVDGEWDDALPDELGEEGGDDGGEEGVDDPLLDGLPDDPQRARKPHDDEDDAEGFEDDGLDDFARELGNEA